MSASYPPHWDGWQSLKKPASSSSAMFCGWTLRRSSVSWARSANPGSSALIRSMTSWLACSLI